MKRGILFLQMKYNDKALEDFNKLCELAEKEIQPEPLPISSTTDPNATPQGNTPLAKSYFYKAKALKKLNNFNDAILYFEQVIRMCDDQFLQSSALYEIAKIKI
jgi:tetratricopeptide (TPR) repeat protein